LIALLDVNVLLALAWPNHVHHDIARRWFSRRQRSGWATCPLTQSAFVRVSANPRVVSAAVTPREAVVVLRQILALPGHAFWPDDISLPSTEHIDLERLLSYRQVTDAHLLAVALRHGGCLATLDRRVLDLVPGTVPPELAVDLLLPE
jgi:uncharacterized protein